MRHTSSGGKIAFLAPPTRIPSPAWTACTNNNSAVIDGSHQVPTLGMTTQVAGVTWTKLAGKQTLDSFDNKRAGTQGRLQMATLT